MGRNTKAGGRYLSPKNTERIQRELAGAHTRDRPVALPTSDWLTSSQTAAALGVTTLSFSSYARLVRVVAKHRPAGNQKLSSDVITNVGWCYWRADIERIVETMAANELRARAACEYLLAQCSKK